MDYRRERDTLYLRIDKGEELVESIKRVCEKEGIQAGYFHGIGACKRVLLSTWIPDKETFIHHSLTGMLEMVSLMGNISTDKEGQPFSHSHAIFSYLNDEGDLALAAGHLEEAEISYTGEIVLEAAGEKIGRRFDREAGIEVWDLD